VNSIADAGSVVELYADYAGAAYTALATVAGTTVAIAATNKTDDKLTEADCAKLARFVRTCDAFSVPVITLVDTLGFDGNAKTELSGSVKALTRLAGSYAEATTAKISVVTGKAVGPVFVALAGKGSNADFTYALENACVAPLAPEAAVEFLWHDKLKGAENLDAKRKELAKEYTETVASAKAAAEKGCVDEIIAPDELRAAVSGALAMLEGKRVTNLPKKHNNFPF
jgi:acetyl-CoA carboxylase carboxyltransferase component